MRLPGPPPARNPVRNECVESCTLKVWEREQRPFGRASFGGVHMDLGTVLIIVLILLLIGAIPRWGYSRSWGYGPSGLVGIILIIVLVLALTGRM